MTNGVIVLDKPAGMTSFAAVAAVRRVSGVKKVGHAGTLDPLATGVLVVALGRATRLIRYIQQGAKEYVAEIQFGIATDTLDADGIETERVPVSFDQADIRAALDKFRGELDQIPPMISALKVDGERLYRLARKGEVVAREPRLITVTEATLLSFDPTPGYPVATVRFVVSKGTYIRALADDLGRTLGGRAHLRNLRRTRVGTFEESSAIGLADLADWESHLLGSEAAVAELLRWQLDETEAQAVRLGQALPAPAESGPWAMVEADGTLLGVYGRRGNSAVAEVVLA